MEIEPTSEASETRDKKLKTLKWWSTEQNPGNNSKADGE
jgi:hypothetical protein